MLKDMGRFLNRILGLKLRQQALVLSFFASILERIAREARRDGGSDECVFEQVWLGPARIATLSDRWDKEGASSLYQN
jgi:hypothetical protein